MEISVNKLRHNVKNLVSLLVNDELYLEKFIKSKECGSKEVEHVMDFLSEHLLDEAFIEPIAASFKDCLLLLVSNAFGGTVEDIVNANNFADYQRKSVALSKLMHLSNDVKEYARKYFLNKPAPFSSAADLNQSLTNKKCRVVLPKPSSSNIIKCCYRLLKADTSFFKNLWNWSEFTDEFLTKDFFSKKGNLQDVYINHILAFLCNMNSLQVRQLNLRIPVKHLIEFENHDMLTLKSSSYKESGLDTITLPLKSSLVCSVEGVLLSIFNKENYDYYDNSHDNIVKVDSTKANLRSIALGVANSKAICLSGPVGCGKTTLVEYLARKTGRIAPKRNDVQVNDEEISFEEDDTNELKITKPGIKRKSVVHLSDERPSLVPNRSGENGFLRIQLGDQTDSKMLLGQYHCTDVPGEFVWLPGVLTQAVMNGYWLLLEDLDSANQDTYTVLSSLLGNKYLSVPGFSDCVKIAPGFQLFVTVRTLKSSSNTIQKTLLSLLEKYLYTINILPLSRNELCKVVATNYPKLTTIANRIVDVFLIFSSGDHSVADNLRQQETNDKADTTDNYVQLPCDEISISSISNSSRMVSTRDLIKLCQRSNPTFSVTSTECAYFVFQNAVDVFCSYIPQSRDKTKLITAIGAKLGIIQSRCEHLADEYKPETKLNREYIKVGRAELQTRKVAVEDDNTSVSEHWEHQACKRLKLMNSKAKDVNKVDKKPSTTFSFTRMASCMLERIAVCVQQVEPVLLVGETGVGKTSSVQFLAERTEHKLVVVNMNNQSDVSDLIGGFKPIDFSYVISPLRSEFEFLFRHTFNVSKNESFLSKFSTCYNQGNFPVIVKLMLKIVSSVFEKAERNELRAQDKKLIPRWRCLKMKLQKLSNQLNKSINISFAFIPGSLVNCIKFGDWVLLDEINLASAETLECLSTILEPDGSVVLLEKGDFTPVKRHPDFRIFACMNPNTDVGKKDLPVGIRNRFTELYVDEITSEADLRLLISDYLKATGIQKVQIVTNIVKLYVKLKKLAKLELNDGLGNRPVYSLRTLCRSLNICARNLCGSIERNLYESFSLSFLTQLDPSSHSVVQQLIQSIMLSNTKAILKQEIPKPNDSCLNFEGYWIQKGPKELQECSNYILTDSVRSNLKDLARIVSIGKFPVLLQGPTSAGKTSLIEYLAKRSGNYCLRINNHEHTDLQEYIGSYTADISGKLIFKEGVLVQAMRQGYWIILDELNLASTEILEALNRVLDDNRELFIPETQTVVRAHPNFMLFATQNPPGLYGGRKTLSRAFKNRFIELHFSEIPRAELEIILEKRCLIPASYARKMVACMADLQKNRKTTSKNIFTLRDLFRWGNRYTWADKKLLLDQKYDWNQHLIEEGYLVLSSKVRSDLELEIITQALYKNFKKHVDLSRLFDIDLISKQESPVTSDIIQKIKNYKHRTDVVWTRNMTRMAVLTAKALEFNEPALLVGPTGCGKTTVCQLLAKIRNVPLRILNCHMHTEGADFLGGLRPCRQNDDTNNAHSNKLFEWSNGPLIYAMLEGSYFMADEISLAEDSVLERLNCVLEPERTVLLAEKGGITSETADEKICQEFMIQAQEGFQFLATMNPGGDFGKKELSPALRNRFTEIWCQPSDTREDLIQIANNCMQQQLLMIEEKDEVMKMAQYIVEIVLFIQQKVEKFKFSIRDILAWANYIINNKQLSFGEKAVFGLETIFLDALEMLPFESLEKVDELRSQILEEALKQTGTLLKQNLTLEDLLQRRGTQVEYISHEKFGIKPFFIAVNKFSCLKADENFLFDAPTTKNNLFRLLSALTLKKPILLEGPPGVGKTSIVECIAQAIGFQIVRINLCEHTDLADLFGTDLPAEDNILCGVKNQENDVIRMGSFVWRDGPLLAALKSENTWILLDELNLAPQSVLEGLNAILDHRGEVYLPELNKTFSLPKRTRIFACQNPLKQGGGRKGLPQSFLNRFTKVYLRKLTSKDLLHVINRRYESQFLNLKEQFIQLLLPTVNLQKGNLFDIHRALKNNQPLENVDSTDHNLTFDLASKMVNFSELLDRGLLAMEFGYKGGPYEINLRDILRWCDLLIHPETCYSFQPSKSFVQNFDEFLLTVYERMKLVYYQRMRCTLDKAFIINTFAQVFKCNADHLNSQSEDVALYWTSEKIYLNDIVLSRHSPNKTQSLHSLEAKQFSPLLLTSQREGLKNIIECVHMEKPVLLCGSTDTGKTKLIDVLCTLTNQVCVTDTIDDSVTGSFQQVDLNRHLEEISKQVEHIYLKCMQNALLNKTTKCKEIFTQLLDSWSSYNGLASTNCKNANTLNTGGHFEWVDSKIVKSLKYGQYIALEHVNLCSSAVLDRLNSVFEPKGKLLISEKGVNAGNDSVEVVEKEKNFRAFLTIDPKNGELSRAMRNRCSEIFLNREKYDLDDKRMIVYAEGVCDIKAINTMITIHESIVKLTEINNYSISHLTKMAFLAAAYHHIGYDLERAIYVSAMEVYVYSANMDLTGYGLVYYQQQLRDIVLKESQKYGSFTNQNNEDYLRYLTLRSEGLSETDIINLQIVPLKIALQEGRQQYGDTLKEIFTNFAKINFEDIMYEDLLKYLLFIVYQASTFADLERRHLQLQHLFALYNAVDLQKLSEKFYKTLQEFDNDFSDLNFELPWNTKLFPRIRDYRNINLQDIEGKISNVLSALLMNMVLQDIPVLPVISFLMRQQMDQLLNVIPTYGNFTAKDVRKKFITQKSSKSQQLRNIIMETISYMELHLKELQLCDEKDKKITDDFKKQLKDLIVDFNASLNNEKDMIIPDNLKYIETELLALTEEFNQEEMLTNMENKKLEPKEIELQMISLREYFLTKFCVYNINDRPNQSKDHWQLNHSYCENELSTLDNKSWKLLQFMGSDSYKIYRKIWSLVSNQLQIVRSFKDMEDILDYLNGHYRHLNALNRLIVNNVQSLQLKNLALKPSFLQALRTEEDIESLSYYEGPALINAICGTLYQTNSDFKIVPFEDLELWKSQLKQIRELLWFNGVTMSSTFNTVCNNYKICLENAKRLLKEINYVKHLSQHLENDSDSSDFSVNFQKLISKLNAALQTEKDATDSNQHESLKFQSLLYKSGIINTLMGAIELNILTYVPLIDPVEKNHLKNLYNQEDIDCLNTLKTSFDFLRIIMKYKQLGEEYYQAIEEQLNKLQLKKDKLQEKMAKRSKKCLYSLLVKDIKHYLKTNCDPLNLINLLENIENCCNKLLNKSAAIERKTLDLSIELQNKINIWLTNSQGFLQHTLKPYAGYYEDFIKPLQCAVEQLSFGFKSLNTILTQLKHGFVEIKSNKSLININSKGEINKILQNILEYPRVQPLLVAHNIDDISQEEKSCPLYRILHELPKGGDKDYFLLLKVKLKEIQSFIHLEGKINQNHFRDLDFSFKIINKVWQKEEELRHKWKVEEESLYINKTKCIEDNPVLEELQELEEMFPTSVKDDFGDFLQENSLDEIFKFNKQTLKKSQYSALIKDEDYTFIAKLFMQIYQQYPTFYHQPVRNKSCQQTGEFVHMFKDSMQVFLRLYQHYRSSLNEWLDEESFNSLAFSVALQQQNLELFSLDEVSTTKSYNFYKDSNIQEIVTCGEVLNKIEKRVSEQLELYPEHAALVDIKKIIRRIRQLPATAPIVRFSTGFQILRQKVSQWNEVAHKNNNLQEEEIKLAEFIQNWTRFELQFWRNCLQQRYEKVESQAFKYWFFIYDLLKEYLENHSIDSNLKDMKYCEKRFVHQEVLESSELIEKTKIEFHEVIKILRQFLESGTYGDFHIRLRLLKAFEFYLNHSQAGKEEEKRKQKTEQLIAGLHNLQIYFQQFINEIEEWKKAMQAPLEKKLKDLVKIESYNKDLSYFSMRHNVAKVHRNLNKILKEYQQQLEQKITPVFQMKESITHRDLNTQRENGGNTPETYLRNLDIYIAAANLKEIYITSSQITAEGNYSTSNLLNRISHLYHKSREVVENTLKNHKYTQQLTTLDIVLQQQLEHCNDLRQLSVDRGKERAKQVLEAKHILQRKRKALSDFFKLLTLLGINYKTGLSKLSLMKENEEFENYQIPPLCLETTIKIDSINEVGLKNINLDFARANFKLKILLNIMLTPLSDLGLPNIDRIKGFAAQMFLLVQEQRNSLARGCRNFYDFNYQLRQMKNIALILETSMSDENLKFIDYQQTYQILMNSFVHIAYVLGQFKLLIKCVPTKDVSENRLLTNFNNLLTKDSLNFTNVTKLIDEILFICQTTLEEMQGKYCEFLNPNDLDEFVTKHEKVKKLLENILNQLKTSLNDYLPLAKPILQLLEQIRGMHNNNANVNDLLFTENDFENFENKLENILHIALISLEKLYKKSCSKQTKDETSQDIEEYEELDQLQESHLKQHLTEDLVNNWKILNLSELNQKLTHILLLIKHSSFPNKIFHIRKLISIIPILEQFQLMANYQITQQIFTHKLSAKILTIMLSVFVEISSKGFCVPPDLMQDAEAENKQDGQQQQGEKFGLEDGTGEKDASNKIESEDQLEDAQRPEDRNEKKDNDESDCKEEKGIDVSENFEGDMQDLEKPEKEEDDSGESETEEDVNKEMGETDTGAEKLDDQIWGDDEEEEEKEQEEQDLNEEEQGKGSKDEKDSHNDLNAKNEVSSEDTKDEQNQEGLDATNEDQRKQKEKDITDMKESEVNEEQDNPFHNELEDPPEAEEMDLGDLNGNDNNDNDNEADDQLAEENPFEIDKMKENMPTKDQEDDYKEETENQENKNQNNESISSDSEEEVEDSQMQREKNDVEEEEIKDKPEEMEEEQSADEANLQKRGEIDEKPESPADNQEDEKDSQKDDLKENYEQSKDKRSVEDNIQAGLEMENDPTADEVQATENDKNIKQDQKLDEQQTGEEKDGVGQAETENNDGGHQGIAETNEITVQEERKNEKQTQEKRKQGCTNEERTLGEAEKNKIKQLKTIEKLNEEKQNDETNDDDDHNEPQEAEEYQHVKEPKNNDKITLDNATEEQSKKLQHVENEMDNNEEENDTEMIEDLMDIDEDREENTENNLQELSSEKLDKKSEKSSKSEKNREQTETIERMEVEGDIVETLTTMRKDDTTAHCNQDLLLENDSHTEDITTNESLRIRKMYQQEVNAPKPILPLNEDNENWHIISNRMAQNARDLCEQLRLILEPTKCTRLKGDYRTGRRINMKKIIPYIASQFRKDKIWLRRTKPSQRDYKITIAIDDSKSMHHNNSKMLTLEAISLVSQALILLESGRLSVLSFGEKPQIILNHTEQFDGAKLVNYLNFSQDKTKIAELLDFARTIITEECCMGSDNGIFENLLLVLSDGRNIFSEGKTKVKNSIKLARLQRIFLVYIIIDNPENKNSILDIQSMEMLPDKKINIKSYLDDFPFPYYVIVRDLNQLPLVLSEAMRQWFELVNSEQ
uniref:Midasin n=1 Tax=Glossina brevipalpis TaxID=37001 RepID=A0A1A9WWJ4_9MUSC